MTSIFSNYHESIMTPKEETVYVNSLAKVDIFMQLLQSAESLLTAISGTEEYKTMVKRGLHGSNDLTLGDAITAVIECRDEYYSMITDEVMQAGEL